MDTALLFCSPHLTSPHLTHAIAAPHNPMRTVDKVIIGCALVSVNYLLGIVIVALRGDAWTLTVYFSVACLVWAWACSVGVSTARHLLAGEGWIGGADVVGGSVESEQLLQSDGSSWEDPRDSAA
jgi:hypothetical protein